MVPMLTTLHCWLSFVAGTLEEGTPAWIQYWDTYIGKTAQHIANKTVWSEWDIFELTIFQITIKHSRIFPPLVSRSIVFASIPSLLNQIPVSDISKCPVFRVYFGNYWFYQKMFNDKVKGDSKCRISCVSTFCLRPIVLDLRGFEKMSHTGIWFRRDEYCMLQAKTRHHYIGKTLQHIVNENVCKWTQISHLKPHSGRKSILFLSFLLACFWNILFLQGFWHKVKICHCFVSIQHKYN